MRIDFSEPECSNCYHCRTSGILNKQESEPSSVIGSPVTLKSVSPGPVQEAPAHHSVSVGSTSTSTSTSSPFSFGSAPAATSTSTSSPFCFGPAPPATSKSPFSFGPVQVPPNLPSIGSPSLKPASQAPVLATSSGSGASGTSTSSTSSPDHSSSPSRLGSAPAATTSVSSGTTQSLAPTTSSLFGSAPAFTSVSSAPTQAFGQTSLGFGQNIFGSGASATSTSSTSSPLHSSSPFGSPPALTSVSSAPTQAFGQTSHGFGQTNFGFGAFSAPTPPRFGITQEPVQAGASSSSPYFGNAFARPDVGISSVTSSSTTTVVFGTTPVSVSSSFGPTQAPSTFPTFGCIPAARASGSERFGQNHRSVFGTPTEGLHSQFGSKSGANTYFPGFGVGYLPGDSSNLFSPNPPNFGGGSVGAGTQPFGFCGTTTTTSPSSPFSSPSLFSSNPKFGSHPFAFNRIEQGSRIPGYAPTATGDGQNKSGWSFPSEISDGRYISISASEPYQHKSHEELRWEDYKRGDKGVGWLSGAHTNPIGSGPNADFTNGFYPGMNRFQSSISPSSTTVPPINSSVQRPHETTTVPPPVHGCTACGATSSSSTSGHFTFNGATSPPSATTTPPGMFFPITGFVSMMFGTNLAVQGTTPALQAYPVQGYVFLPFAAMRLQ